MVKWQWKDASDNVMMELDQTNDKANFYTSHVKLRNATVSLLGLKNDTTHGGKVQFHDTNGDLKAAIRLGSGLGIYESDNQENETEKLSFKTGKMVLSENFELPNKKITLLNDTSDATDVWTGNTSDHLNMNRDAGYHFRMTSVNHFRIDSSDNDYLKFTSNTTEQNIISSHNLLVIPDGAGNATFFEDQTSATQRYLYTYAPNSGDYLRIGCSTTEGILTSNNNQITFGSDSANNLTLRIEGNSAGGGGIKPWAHQTGSVGGSSLAFKKMYSCNFYDVCSEIPIPKRALSSLDNIMKSAVIDDTLDTIVLKSEKLPTFLTDEENHMRSVSATLSFLQGCIVELYEEVKALKAN